MLTGTFRHTVDGKNRFFIPAKHREQLGESFMIVRGIDPCLTIYSMNEWEKFNEKLEALPRAKASAIARFIYADATDVQPDSQGRIILPPTLLAYAGIEKNAVVIGCGKYSEIWAEDKYDAYRENENAADIQSLMLELGF